MVQRQSRCDDPVHVVEIINAAGMDETYSTYVDDECFDIHDNDEDTDHDTDDDDDDADDDTDDGGRGKLCTIKAQGSRFKAQGSRFKAQGLWSRIKDLVRP